jgi:hypothetical protein
VRIAKNQFLALLALAAMFMSAVGAHVIHSSYHHSSHTVCSDALPFCPLTHSHHDHPAHHDHHDDHGPPPVAPHAQPSYAATVHVEPLAAHRCPVCAFLHSAKAQSPADDALLISSPLPAGPPIIPATAAAAGYVRTLPLSPRPPPPVCIL